MYHRVAILEQSTAFDYMESGNSLLFYDASIIGFLVCMVSFTLEKRIAEYERFRYSSAYE